MEVKLLPADEEALDALAGDIVQLLYEPEYARVRTLAFIAIVLYPLGITIFLAALLFIAREPLRVGDSTPFTRAIAFLHREYEARFFWWEAREVGLVKQS